MRFLASFVSITVSVTQTLPAQTTVTGITADAQVSATGANTASNPMLAGFSGSTGMCPVFVFQLPSLPAGHKIGTASVSVFYYGKDGSPSFNADLYGLPCRTASTVLSSDFYAGPSDPNATLIQDNFATPSSGSTGVTTGTNAAGDLALANYLNIQYQAGGTGKFVFLRLSPDAVLTNNFTRYKYNSAEASAFYQPKLTFTTTPSEYTWSNVRVEGGGYVTGLVAHPAVAGLIYARTDIGGAYRWDSAASSWVAITDSFTSQNRYGIESIAIDPNDSNRIYIAAGKYFYGTDSDIMLSTDRGATWTALAAKTPNASGTQEQIKLGGNETTKIRFAGERMTIDPNNGNILYYGTAKQGLWRRDAAAATKWTRITSLPTSGLSDYGLTFVVCDRNGGVLNGRSQTIYAGAFNNTAGNTDGGVYRSTDAGASWVKLSGGLPTPMRGEVASDGTLYVTYGGFGGSGGVAKGKSSLTSVNPPTTNTLCGLSIHPSDPLTVVCAERVGSYTCKLFRTTNGGSSWTQISNSVTNSGVTRLGSQWFGAVSDVQMRPDNPNEVWVSDWIGVVRTSNITTAPVAWTNIQKGHEEIVPLILKSPSSGAPLLSGAADVNGFRHTSLSAVPTAQFNNPTYTYTTGIDFCESNPNVVARVAGTGFGGSGNRCAYSLDNGATWTQTTSQPSGVAGGRVAVSSGNSQNFIWMPENYKGIYYTTNRGASWTLSNITGGSIGGEFEQDKHPMCADRVTSGRFYLLSANADATNNSYANVSRSDDNGATFTQVGTISFGQSRYNYAYKLEAAPGIAGQLWCAIPYIGVFRSNDAGVTWSKVTDITSVSLFAFGKSAPGRTNPTLFLRGTATGIGGILRSDDVTSIGGNGAGATWTKISIPEQPVGDNSRVMEGDRQVYGRVYLGTDGRGIYVGAP